MCEHLLLLLALGRATPSPEALLRAADASRHVLQEGVMRIHAAVREDEKPPTESDLDVYVKGADRALCVFQEGRQRGRKVLTVGDRVWLLVPGTSHPIRISANQRLLGGASVADVAQVRLADQFVGAVRADEETVDGILCAILDLTARSSKMPYASATLWVGKEDELPRRLQLTLRSGKKAKEIRFIAYGEELGRTVLRRMEVHHLLASERGRVTTLEFVRYDPRAVADEVFDPVLARALP